MANAHEVLKMTGMGFGYVVPLIAYIASIEELPSLNEVYRGYLPDDPPSRATIQVAALKVGTQVELLMITVKAE